MSKKKRKTSSPGQSHASGNNIRILIVCGIGVVILGIMIIAHNQQPARPTPSESIQVPSNNQSADDNSLDQLMAQAEQNPGDVNIQHSAGNILVGQKHDREALKYLARAAALESTDATTYNDIGVAHAHLDEQVDAVAAYEKAMKLNPDYTEAEFNLGTAYMAMGNTDEAIRFFIETIRMDKTFYRAYNNLGGVYAQKGDFEKAIAQYEAALQVKSDFTDAHQNLAIIYDAMGDSVKAREHQLAAQR
jgi:tetratricopeptide (TPR) repeat protein